MLLSSVLIGRQKHDCCLVDAATSNKEFSVIKHSPQAIQEWATSLRQRFGGRAVAVTLERSRGPLIFALLKYDFLALYPINPSTLARYREAFSPSRAKALLFHLEAPDRRPVARRAGSRVGAHPPPHPDRGKRVGREL